MNDHSGHALAGQALVSDQAPSGLAASRFDPSCEAITECSDCGLSNCICFGDDDQDEDDEFDCHMGPDGQCGAAGSEMCDWECPTMRALTQQESRNAI